MSWAEKEFATLALGDKRRNNRVVTIVESFADNINASIPGSSESWAETQATYRLLANPEVSWDKLLEPHAQQTLKRCGERPVVLCLQDTTELDFSTQQIHGMGRLNYDARHGMYLHQTLCVTPERVALGVLDSWMWAREPRDVPMLKESSRWIEGYERVAECAQSLPQTQLIYVADRESDIGALFLRAQALNFAAEILIRAKHNRRVKGETDKLWEGFTPEHVLGEMTFDMPQRDGRKGRQVCQTISMRRCEVELGPKKEPVEMTVILAQETQPPEGSMAVSWKLLSSIEVGDLADAQALINHYRARWEIEQYFHVLKNGCKVESLQLSTIERIENALTLYSVVAWRVLRLMRQSRDEAEADCGIFYSDEEWQCAYLLTKTALPKERPTLREVTRTVAKLGGFLGRKSDGEPGVKALWIGLQRLVDAVAGMRLMREQMSCV